MGLFTRRPAAASREELRRERSFATTLTPLEVEGLLISICARHQQRLDAVLAKGGRAAREAIAGLAPSASPSPRTDWRFLKQAEETFLMAWRRDPEQVLAEALPEELSGVAPADRFLLAEVGFDSRDPDGEPSVKRALSVRVTHWSTGPDGGLYGGSEYKAFLHVIDLAATAA